MIKQHVPHEEVFDQSAKHLQATKYKFHYNLSMSTLLLVAFISLPFLHIGSIMLYETLKPT